MEHQGKAVRWSALWSKYKFVALVALAGVILLLWPSRSDESTEPTQTVPTVDEASVLRETEERMAEILSRIKGVGALDLMLTVESSAQRELAADTELSYSGQTSAPDDYTRRTETVILSDGSGDAPVVTRSVSPAYRGALVVCEGAGNAAVKLAVTQAVAALTGLGSDRIMVIECQS